MRNGKLVGKPQRVKTSMSETLVTKLISVEKLANSLSTGSKSRLREYQSNLATSRGVDKPLFDDRVKDLLFEYVWDVHNCQEVIDYLNNLKDKDGYSFSRDLKIYSSCEEALLRFSERDHTTFRWNENYQQSLKVWKEVFSRKKLVPLSYKSDDDIRQSLPKEDTHSGYYYIISGKKRKGDNMEGILKEYLKQRSDALKEGSFNKPILIGFRTQASGEFDDEGYMTGKCKHKLRVVSMVDLIQIIAELTFAKPIQSMLGSSSFYAGGKDEIEISKYLSNWRTKWDKFISIDYSSYDQTISSWLIEDAFDVIKSSFSLSRDEEDLWNVIVHDFIHKDFILNEGILHSDKGVPSGSMFTQIIDSVVNVIVITTYFISKHKEASMMAMGDDNIIFCDSDVEMSDIASYISKNFGLIVKTDDKSNEGLTSRDPKFLSRYWTYSGTWRHPNQLISRMLFPERYRDYSHDHIRPEWIIYAYMLTYPKGMRELIDVNRFMQDYPGLTRRYIMKELDSRYIPGALSFIRNYT